MKFSSFFLLNPDKLIITSDDFGLYHTVDQAILQTNTNGALTHASILAKSADFSSIKTITTQAQNLTLGLHFDLTHTKPTKPFKGLFGFLTNFGIVGLLLLSILRPIKFSKFATKEILHQLNILHKNNININYIDGHHHVVMIPTIFKIANQIAHKRGLQRIRWVNESIILAGSSNFNSFTKLLKPKNLLRCLIIRTCYYLNIVLNSQYTPNNTYFISILHSCSLDITTLMNTKIPKNTQYIEIMLHPALKSDHIPNNNIEHAHLTSPLRQIEYQTAIKLKPIKPDSSFNKL